MTMIVTAVGAFKLIISADMKMSCVISEEKFYSKTGMEDYE